MATQRHYVPTLRARHYARHERTRRMLHRAMQSVAGKRVTIEYGHMFGPLLSYYAATDPRVAWWLYKYARYGARWMCPEWEQLFQEGEIR